MRKGDFVGTYKGNEFWPLDPRPEEVDIVDIIHSLSQICRYNGHTKHFWSVAQHSLLVEHIIRTYLKVESPEVRLLGLLHDASEAYINDICRPVKRHLLGYDAIEDKIQKVVLEHCKLYDKAVADALDIVHTADNIAIAVESSVLMRPKTHWNLAQMWKPEYECLCNRIVDVSMQIVEYMMTKKCKELMRELDIDIPWIKYREG